MSYFLREVLHGNGSRDDVDSEAESAVVARDFASLMYNCVVKANKNEILRIPMTKEFELKVSKDKEETSTSEVLQAKFVVGPPSSFACTAMAKAVLARYGGNLGFCMEEVISEDEPGPSRQNANDGSSSPQNRDQLVGAGLSCIFEILQQLSRRDAELCVQALDSLLGLIQTMPVDCLRHENKASIIAMIAILKKLREEGSPSICAQASSCLAALSVACGEPEHIASAIQSLICLQRIVNVSSDSSYDQIQVPENLHRLLLKVRQKISHRLESGESWASTSLQNHRVMCSFDLPSLPNDSPDESPDDDHRLYAAIACDGAFIYVLNYVGLYKLGTGLQETIIGKLYASNQALKATKNCLLTFCNSSLYLRRSQSSCISVVDVDSLSDIGEVVLPTCAVHSAIFSDGFTFYRATLTINSTLSIVPLNDSFVPVAEGVPRRKFRLTDVAFASFGDKRSVPHQLPQYLPANLQSQAVDLQMGKDIAFLQARSGKVYYAGNGTRFGLHETGNVWMELVLPEPVVQISVGSENVMFRSGAGHAWIAGVDEKRRNGRLRRLATANRRKTVSVCCCSSTFAYATENGKVFVGGRHSMRVHPTSDMLVGLDWVHIASVSLGKTHGAAISRSGHLYTWGFNNLNQCGRVEQTTASTSPRKLKVIPPICKAEGHVWVQDIPSACAQCGLCSSRGAACGRVARPKGTICNCGIGESTCLKCGLCRSCGQMAEPTTSNVASQNSPCGSTPSTPNRMVLLPARVTLCKGAHDVKVSSLSCGNFHTILLAADKRVFTFGSNCHGQLGVGDVASKTQPQQVNLPADVVVVQVAAGANHSVLRTSDGAVYTFGTHSKGQLARASDNTAAWHCVPGRVPGYGPGSPAFASWVGADGDVTLIHSHTALLTNDDVVYSQIVASKNDIFIFPREIGKDYIVVRRKYNTFEHFSIGPSGLYTFWTMEPRFDMLWSYNAAEMKVQALSVFTKHAKVKDCNDALESLSFLATPEFAVPVDAPAYITSTQMGILLLSSAFAAHTITNSELWSDKVEESPSASDLVATERYSIANRFEGAGGGWGYSAHSIEAIQFKVSKEVRLVGVGLYGGRGEYMSKLKLYRLLGGDADELYVEQITETDETLYDCGAHETATLLFTQPIVIHANQWHVISAKISGPSSDCGASGKCTIDCDGVTFTFRNSVVSNNGTDVNVGQIPELYYQMNCQVEPGKNEESMKPLDLSISRIFLRSCLENVTPNVLTSLLAVLDWSIITLVNEDTEGDEKSWRAERAAFVALVTMRSISRYVLLVYTDSPTAEEPSFEFASRLVELHTMLISFFEGQSILFDEVTSTGMLALTANLQNISLQQVMSEAIRLFVSLSHCFMGSRGLINAHLVAAMKCGLQSEFLIAAVVGSLAKIGRIVEFLLNISCEERFPLLSAQLAKQFDNEETDLKTLTSYQNVLRFLYDLCFHNQMTNVHNTSKLTQDIIVKISHELAIPSVDRCLGPTVHQTSSRFRRRSGQANWDMSDGCPDAIAFRVDLEGVKLHGFGVYLTSDQEKLPISGEIYMLTPEAPEKWTCLFRVSVELSADGQDFGVVRFPDQVLLSPGVTYAIKVWTTKISKTYCGEGGANQLRLSNGARFFFSGCSLSQNGTTVQRGQIPFILYSIAESSRGLHVTQEKIHESYLLLLRLLSNKIGAAINSGYLSECARSIVSRISGHTIVFMEKFPDKCLEIMATLEPLIPLISNANGMIKASTISASFSKESQLSESPCIPVVVESPHPYKPNSVFSMVVGFDESVDFMCVRFSPNCETAQFDDQLCVYLGVDRHSYMPIDNYYGSHEWPSCPMFLPGNSLWFVLESASPLDGATAEQMYGFHVTVTGYPAASRNSDLRLEQELVWLSANACRIMVQLPTNPKSVEHLSTAEDDTKHLFERHGCLLKKGLSLSHAPTLNELIVKGPPQPAQSSELQFLRQFLSCHPSTAAGFLGSWLPTGPIVDPSKCQLAITHEEMVVGKPVRVKFSCRDQFDREVECNNISVEVLMTMGLQDASKTQNISADSLPSVLLIQQNPFQPVIINHAKYMSICAMAAFSNYSIEEIRLGYMREDLVRDRIILRHRNKSVFAGSWTPMAPGTYRMDCKVDGYEISQFYTVDVMETNKVEHVEKMWRPGAQLTTAQSVVLPFSSDFSGIRMRLGTTLASTCVGTIPRGAIIEYIEEIENDDGKWIRLTDETSILYGYSGGSAQVWCMAFHRPLRRDLIPLNEKKTEQPGKLIKPGTLSQASGQYQSVAIDAFETYIVPANDVLQVYSQPNMNALMDNERIVGPCDLVSSGWLSNRNGVWIKIAGSQKYVLQSDGSSLDGLDSSLSFSTNGNEEDELRRQSSVALPIATPPSIADCSRAVFAAFIWHEHLVKDAMAAAAYLKFHSNLHNIWHSSESLSSTNAPVALQPIVKLWREVCVTVETSVDQHLIVPPVANKLFATDTPKPGSSNCELCENAIKVPLTVHFRMAHPGCGGDCQGYGYNSSGKFTTGWSGECGAGGRGASPWYLMCNNCRSQYLRKTPTGHQQETIRRRRDFRLSTSAAEARPELIIKANALFLLDLNSSLDCDSKDSSQTTSGWTINLFPTQSSTPSTMPRSAKARLDNSIAKSSYMAQSLMRAGHTSDPGPKVGLVGSSYVASLNQTVSLTRQPTVCDAQAQAFLQSPSTALRTLFSHTNPSTSALLKRPVLAFCLEHHNLKRIRTACAQSVRRAVAFSHAFRVWNWLLRLVSSETSVSDIILQYLTALTSYKRLEEYVVQGRKQQSVLPHPWRLCFLAGPIAGQMVFQLHSFLYTISVILQSSGIDGRLRSLCFNAWTLQLTDQEQDLLILTCNILATVGRVLSEASVMELSRIDKNDSVDVKEMRDVTHCTRIEASSRQAMVTCLTDGNAETFWESGDEDKNRVRTLNVVLDADGVVGVLLSVFVDNVRDENYRISSIVFRTVLPGGTRKELATSCTEKNFCGWVKCCIANVKNVSIALKGLNPSSRIRQLSVLGFCPQSAQHSLLPPSNSHHLFFNSTQRDAFALFQSISSQAFCGELSQDETLRERVIDLLFSRVQLYPLQNYVCTQVVQAMEREVEVLCSCSKKNFSYCCGLMELLVRICDSRGASELSVQGNSILVSITQMLVFAPIVVQRQCLNSLECVLGSFAPGNVDVGRVLRNLLIVIGKVVQLQIRDKAAHEVTTVYLCSSVQNAPQSWRIDKPVETDIGRQTAQIVSRMCDGSFSAEWAEAVKAELAKCLLDVVQMSDSVSSSHSSSFKPNVAIVSSKRFWLAITALAMIKDKRWLELSERWRSLQAHNDDDPMVLCENHDDGHTEAQVLCLDCEIALCKECFTVMHLHKKNRNHGVKTFARPSAQHDVNIHQGCARMRIANVLVLFHGEALNGMVEVARESIFPPDAPVTTSLQSSSISMTRPSTCRFCGNAIEPHLQNLDGTCDHEDCVSYATNACSRALVCSHLCGGIRGELNCLPCLRCYNNDKHQDGDDVCVVCFTERLGAAPCVQIDCGHIFHFHCLRSVLQRRWNGPRILFRFINCPLCNLQIKHPGLFDLLEPVLSLRDDVIRKAKMRLEYDGLLSCPVLVDPRSEFYNQPEEYALDRYMYVLCHKCNKAYFGGESRCQNALDSSQYNPEELICGACSDTSGVQVCNRHGVEFLEYKCRFCCSIAVYFCFGTTHFCAPCHDDFQRLMGQAKAQLPQCPVGPRAMPLEGGSCPLKIVHPPTGEEFAMGCGICRNISTF